MSHPGQKGEMFPEPWKTAWKNRKLEDNIEMDLGETGCEVA
jgi:hypothetical protein